MQNIEEKKLEERKNYTTSDIGIAAYLQLHGLKLVKRERAPTGRFHFEFEDEENICQLKSLEFLSSDFCKFDNNVRNLKKILLNRN